MYFKMWFKKRWLFSLSLNVLKSKCNSVRCMFLYIIMALNEIQYNQSKEMRRMANSKSQHPWWRHQMEAYSASLAICAGNSQVTGKFPAKRPVTRSFDAFFDLRLNTWLSKQSWGDLGCHRTHHEVIVMVFVLCPIIKAII